MFGKIGAYTYQLSIFKIIKPFMTSFMAINDHFSNIEFMSNGGFKHVHSQGIANIKISQFPCSDVFGQKIHNYPHVWLYSRLYHHRLRSTVAEKQESENVIECSICSAHIQCTRFPIWSISYWTGRRRFEIWSVGLPNWIHTHVLLLSCILIWYGIAFIP